jgi:phage baseplate assembly protein V
MWPNDAPTWCRGIVKQLDPAKARVKVLLPDQDLLLTDWLPVVVPFAAGAKAYWLPRLNSQVVVLLDEHGEDGVVVGAIYSQADPAPISAAKTLYIETDDGTKVSIDPVAQLVAVDTPGSIQAKAGVAATVEAPTITLKGAVTVDGTLAVTQAATMQADLDVTGKTTAAQPVIGGKDFAQHKHQAQGATAITTIPV